MLSVEDNELLTRTGPGTPMGELMRRYWHPVCAADELLKSPFRTKEVKILGEELVVYRDRSGALGVVDKYCTHRRASLAYGVVESEAGYSADADKIVAAMRSWEGFPDDRRQALRTGRERVLSGA